jgi:hypothetical protein
MQAKIKTKRTVRRKEERWNRNKAIRLPWLQEV